MLFCHHKKPVPIASEDKDKVQAGKVQSAKVVGLEEQLFAVKWSKETLETTLEEAKGKLSNTLLKAFPEYEQALEATKEKGQMDFLCTLWLRHPDLNFVDVFGEEVVETINNLKEKRTRVLLNRLVVFVVALFIYLYWRVDCSLHFNIMNHFLFTYLLVDI